MVWDDTIIKQMNFKIKYNLFNKSSKSEIEVDCICNNIIIDKLELVDEENKLNTLESKQVDISNLKYHIKYCTSLIDL